VGPQLGCAPRIDVPVTVPTGPLAGSVAKVELARIPELHDEGGSLLLAPDAVDGQGRRLVLLVVNAGADGFRAYNAYCPHAGCAVAWDAGERQVVCPCHLSRFSLEGEVLTPPAKEPLDAYPVVIDTTSPGTLQIDLAGIGGTFPAAAGGKVTFTARDVPALGAVGGSASGHALGVAFPILVYRTGETAAVAFDARCPHQLCLVHGGAGTLGCACHGSVFDLAGKVHVGPATKDLRPLAIDFDGATFVVTVA
jgi:Rieske Fe-S protein